MDAEFAEEVRAALIAAADPQKAEPMRRYMKSRMPFLGVQKSARTAALKPVFARTRFADHDSLIEASAQLWDGAAHREERYAVLALLREPRHRRLLDGADEPFLRHLITTGAWWDLVDEASIKLVGPLRADIDLRAWAVDDDIWIRRAAIIAQVGAKDGTDPHLLRDVIEPNTHDKRFWITKAIGWALRDYARTDPDWVREFVAGHRLAPLSVREATKHL